MNVANCVASPAINTFWPSVALLPSQFPDEAIPEPDTWMRKLMISQLIKICVSFRVDSP